MNKLFYEFHYHLPSQPRPSSYYMYVEKNKKIYAIFTYILPSLVPQLIPKKEPIRVTDFLNSP